MEADFSGYATKAGLKCSDGRTIMAEAFQHMDGKKVPLVWQHGHNDPNNVLGHAILEARPDGVYAYAFFNDTQSATNARKLVQHGDITAMSIYANQLVEKSKQVFHGVIRELSLVLSGANPGALIDNVRLAHGDGEFETLDDEAVIFTGLSLQHAKDDEPEDEELEIDEDDPEDDDLEDLDDTDAYSDDDDLDDDEDLEDDDIDDEDDDEDYDLDDDDDEDYEDEDMAQSGLYDQEDVMYDTISHAGAPAAGGPTIKEIYDSLTPEQKDVVHFMIGAALEQAGAGNGGNSAQHADNDYYMEGADDMGRNIFENNAMSGLSAGVHLAHEDVQGIVATAIRGGSLKEAVEDYAFKHGIENIDILFPDARTIANTPEIMSRRAEWVTQVLSAIRKTPFSRIKSVTADVTHEEARARGYIKGNMKKEEFFGLAKRVTTPTTIYKKQKLDRDDIVDITDFDVVAWLKAEMRMMLDEELARAVLIGDGRPVDSEDHIRDPQGSLEGAGLRSIMHDHELYAPKITVDATDATTLVDSILTQRGQFRGSGVPTLYTSETMLTRLLTSRDKMGRRQYRNSQELADELRVAAIVPIELLEAEQNLVGIIVNLADYTIGADKGGELSMFDDFDIDYNQYKYLIETRLSGALTKMKSALVLIEGAAAGTTGTTGTTGTPTWNTTDNTPDNPLFDGTTLIIPDDGFVWTINGQIQTPGSTQTVADGATEYLVVWATGTTQADIDAGTATRANRNNYAVTGGTSGVQVTMP